MPSTMDPEQLMRTETVREVTAFPKRGKLTRSCQELGIALDTMAEERTGIDDHAAICLKISQKRLVSMLETRTVIAISASRTVQVSRTEVVKMPVALGR